MYQEPFPLFEGTQVNQSHSFAPGDRIFDLVRGVILTASGYKKQDVRFEYKNGEVEYSDVLPACWMFADGAAQLDKALSDMNLHRQTIMFCKPDVVEFDLKGLSPDAAQRFNIHVRVRNCIGSIDGPVEIKKGEQIFPRIDGPKCPTTGLYFPQILGGKELGIRYGEDATDDNMTYRLFFSGEMGFGFGASYDVSTSKGSIEILASSNIFANVTAVSRQVKNESMKEYATGRDAPEGSVAIISKPVTLKASDIDGHKEENASDMLAIEIENPLNFPVIFELHQGEEIKYHAGFPQRLMMNNGKIVPASTVLKMLTIGCLMEDDLFNDNIHDAGKRSRVISAPCVRKVTGGYVIKVNLYNSGDTFTDDLPDFSEWIDRKSYIGEFLESLYISDDVLGFDYHGIFRGLYGAGTASCCYLTLATLAAAVTQMSNKPTNQATLCTTIRYLMCSTRSLKDLEGPDGLTVAFDDERLFNDYKHKIPEGELAYYAASADYIEIASDTVFKAESVGNYMLMKTVRNGTMHFRIVKLNKAGPIGSESLQVIWDSLGFYEAYDFGLAMAEKLYVRAIRTYEVKVSVNGQRMVMYYNDPANFAVIG